MRPGLPKGYELLDIDPHHEVLHYLSHFKLHPRAMEVVLEK